jgi:ketosteroid isomerase-like protein
MQRRVVLTLMSIVLATAASAADSVVNAAGARDNRVFEQIERDWANALVMADQAGLDRIEAPEYTIVTATGALLSKAQSDGELLNGNQHFDALTISDVEVHRSGNLAVVTGHAKSHENYKSQDNSGDYEFVDIFERRGGIWLAIHAQLTRTALPPKSRNLSRT